MSYFDEVPPEDDDAGAGEWWAFKVRLDLRAYYQRGANTHGLSHVIHSGSVVDPQGYSWRVTLHPLGNGYDARNNMSCYLDAVGSSPDAGGEGAPASLPQNWRRYVEFQFEMVADLVEGEVEPPWISTAPLEHAFEQNSHDWGFSKAFKQSALRRDLGGDVAPMTLVVHIRDRVEMPHYQGKTERQWRNWVAKPEGQDWTGKKVREAASVAEWMVKQWGVDHLRSGTGVVDVGGDPGFLANALLSHGIPVTVVDPCFGMTGKGNADLRAFLKQYYVSEEALEAQGGGGVGGDAAATGGNGGRPRLRVLKRWFDTDMLGDPSLRPLVDNCSAMVALYPDEGTPFFLEFTATVAPTLRACFIPCDDCRQYWPAHDPTYEGFVNHLLREDKRFLVAHGHGPQVGHGPGGSSVRLAPEEQELALEGHPLAMVRDRVDGAPYCQVLLQRTPPVARAAIASASSAALLSRDAARRERLLRGAAPAADPAAPTGCCCCGAGLAPAGGEQQGADAHGRSATGRQSGSTLGACGRF